jgi:hypothetical protein
MKTPEKPMKVASFWINPSDCKHYKYDPVFDEHWSFRGPCRFVANPKGNKLPSPRETYLRMKSAMVVADLEREKWLDENRDAIIAAERKRYHIRLARHQLGLK